VLAAYVERYLAAFPAGALAGLHLGLYEHSSVAAAPFRQVLEGLGARVTRLGHSAVFVPVDTEAIRPEDVSQARGWAAEEDFAAIVSADGDGDRPLVSDEHGEWLRGDIIGILCARFLGAKGVVTPVSSNTALERSGWFPRVTRTRIGSPYVIAGMERLLGEGIMPVVGYEANGGFLLGSAVRCEGGTLPALPTRDALLPVLAILSLARQQGKGLAALCAGLPSRHTDSGRIKDFPVALSRERLGGLCSGDPQRDRRALDGLFAAHFGPLASIDTTDGIRLTFQSGEIAHLRPSGNAPELRAYTEADSLERAQAMNRICMEILAGWKAAG
jgi:phosphomannomutase